MAIVWPTGLDVDGYVAAGRGVEVPRADCPGCGRPMPFWGWYERDVRLTAVVIYRLAIRRARCPRCQASHALLPGFVTWGRLDVVEVIGSAIEAMCAGAGARPVAEGLDVGHTTVRGWRRRFAERAGLLAVGLCRYVVAVGDLAPRLAGPPAVVAVAAARSAWQAAVRRFGAGVAVMWRLANLVVGGHLLSPNMDPLWAAR